MSNKRLIKSTGVISLATTASRVLGFVRDILIANFFGTAIFAEAFVVSFRIPNLLRDLIGEGAANAAFVPVLTQYNTREDRGEFWALARSLVNTLILILFIISVCGILLSPVIVRLIAPGFADDPEKFAITVKLTRIMFPFIFLIGLVACGMGILNSLDHFAIPALGPVFLNLSMIFFLIFVCPASGVTGLAFAVLTGGALQVLSTWYVMQSKGFSFMPFGRGNERFFHPAMKKIWTLLVPRVFGSAVYQLSVIVDNIFSTFWRIVGLGGPAALWYSYRLFHLPLAIFGISMATAALPKMSMEVARDDYSSLKETIAFSLRSIFLVLVPSSIGLMTLGRPIIRILFERGRFTPYSTSITYDALFFYAFGLLACGGIKILVNSFFSMGDTKTPVKVASVSFFINLILNYALMWPLKIGGLALATSIAASANFLMLFSLLSKRIGGLGAAELVSYVSRIALASLVMGAFSFYAGLFLESTRPGAMAGMLGVILIILASVGIYAGTALFLGIHEIRKFLKWVSVKK